MSDIDMLTENSWDAELEERARARAEQWASLMDIAGQVAARVNPIAVNVQQYTASEPVVLVQVESPRLAANKVFGPNHGLIPTISDTIATFRGEFGGVAVEFYGKASRTELVAAKRAELAKLEGEVAS